MSWIFVDKENGGDSDMRSQMRRNMRRGDYRYVGGGSSMRGENYNEAYRDGYKHGWEDHEDEIENEGYRRSRDSRGRYI